MQPNSLGRRVRLVGIVSALAVLYGGPVSAVEWDGGGDGQSWHDQDNWDNDQVPGGTTDVTIENADVFISNPASANSITESGGALHVTSQLALASTSQIEALQLGGILENAGLLTLSGLSRWPNGTMLGAGAVTNSGEFVVTHGAPRVIQDKTFTNAGSMTVDTDVGLQNATLRNSATLELGAAITRRGFQPQQFVNTGTVSTTSATAEVGVPFLNQGGTIEVRGFDGPNPSRLALTNEVILAGGTLIVDDAGELELRGSSQHITGLVEASGDGLIRISTPLQLDAILETSVGFSVVGVSVEADITGSGTWVNLGTATWPARTISNQGGVANQWEIVLSGGTRELATQLNNEATITHESGSLVLTEAGTLENRGSYTVEHTTGIGPLITGSGPFVNNGALYKFGTTPFTIGAPFEMHGTGTVHAKAGDVMFQGGGLSTGGSFVADQGSVIKFNAGRPEFQGNLSASGAGQLDISAAVEFVVREGGLFDFGMQDTVGWNLAGRMELAGTARNTGNARWFGNVVETAGQGRLENQGSLLLDGLSTRTLRGVMENHATVTQMKNLTLSHATVINRGLWKMESSEIRVEGQGTFANQGMLEIPQDNVDSRMWATVEFQNSQVLMESHATLPSLFYLHGGGTFDDTNTLRINKLSQFYIAGSGSSEQVYEIRSGTTTTVGRGLVGLLPPAVIEVSAQAEWVTEVTGSILSPTIDGFQFMGGKIAGTGVFRNAGLMVWFGGEISISSDIRTGANGLVNQGDLWITSGLFSRSLSGMLFNDQGDVYQDADFALTDGGALPGGTVINDGHWLTGNASLTSASAESLFVNLRLFTAEAGTTQVFPRFDNVGTVSVGDGIGGSAVLRFRGLIDQWDSTTARLTGGTWIANPGTLLDLSISGNWVIDGAEVIANSVSFPALSNLTNVQSGVVQLNGITTLNNRLFNSSRVILGSGNSAGKLLAPQGITNGLLGTFDPWNPATELEENAPGSQAEIIPPDFFEYGIDVGEASFVNHGTVRPGGPDMPGEFALTGDFDQSESGRAQFELASSLARYGYDQMLIDGAATLAGAIEVLLLDVADGEPFAPAEGDVFDLIVTEDGLTGTFDTVILPGLVSEFKWDLRYTTHSVKLVVLSADFAGDFNGDSAIDAADAAYLFSQWGTVPPGDSLADINKDGFVDAAEAAILFANWTGDARAVPESCSMIMLVLAIGSLGRRARFRDMAARRTFSRPSLRCRRRTT